VVEKEVLDRCRRLSRFTSKKREHDAQLNSAPAERRDYETMRNDEPAVRKVLK